MPLLYPGPKYSVHLPLVFRQLHPHDVGMYGFVLFSIIWNAVKNMDVIYDTWDVPVSCFPPPISLSIEQAFLFKILQYKMTVYLTCTMAV